MKKSNISNNTIRRLPRYLRKLDELGKKGVMRVSSQELGNQLGFTASQIRQDLSYFGEFGQQGYGYNVNSLREQVAEILGLTCENAAILVGCGNIGKALLCNFTFSECGVALKCAFDTDKSKIGTHINGIEIKNSEEILEYIVENGVNIAILCVPQEAARSVADMLRASGISAIWNFTNVDISEPHENMVENINFFDSLAVLKYYVTETKK